MPLSQTFCILSLPSKNNCTEGPQCLEICLICNEKRAGGSRLFLFDNEVFGRAHFLITNYNEKRAGNCASGKTFPWAKGCIFFPLCSLSLSWTIRHVWFRFLAVFLTSCDSIIISAFFVNIFLGVHHFSDFSSTSRYFRIHLTFFFKGGWQLPSQNFFCSGPMNYSSWVQNHH